MERPNQRLETVTVTTGARLHFGILSYKPATGRHFGGVGLMVDQPGFEVHLTTVDSGRDTITGDATAVERVKHFLKSIRQHSPNLPDEQQYDISVEAAYPFHAGLGSGTQLGLAIAKAVSVLAGEKNVTAVTLAQRVGRGLRSTIGIRGFEQGGLFVDAGHNDGDAVGSIATRASFPDDWRFLIVLPPDQVGLSGSKEVEAFAQLPAMTESKSGLLCRLVLTELLPAIDEANFEQCSATLYEFGRQVGEFFAPVQGGTFGDPRMAALVNHLRQQGIAGVGQSSWGPTLFVLAQNAAQAEQLRADLSNDPRWADCQFWVSAPRNCGASLSVNDADVQSLKVNGDD